MLLINQWGFIFHKIYLFMIYIRLFYIVILFGYSYMFCQLDWFLMEYHFLQSCPKALLQTTYYTYRLVLKWNYSTMVDAYGMLLGFVGVIGVSQYTEREALRKYTALTINGTYRICVDPPFNVHVHLYNRTRSKIQIQIQILYSLRIQM